MIVAVTTSAVLQLSSGKHPAIQSW